MVTEPETDRNAGDDDLLEAFFDAGRAVPAVSEDLTARILSDAHGALRQASLAVAGPAAPPPSRGIFAALVSALGGWPAMTGMAAATAAGVWLGFASPTLLDNTGLVGSDYTLGDLMPSAVLAVADASGE